MREWLAELRSLGHSVALRPRVNMARRARELAGFDDSWDDKSEPVVFLNGRLLRLPEFKGKLPNAICDSDGTILWASLSGQEVSDLLELAGTKLAELLVKRVDGAVQIAKIGGLAAQFVWDYMAYNETLLRTGLMEQSESMLGSNKLFPTAGVQLVGSNPVYVGKGASILPNVVFDSTDGPIWIGKNVVIEPNCYIKGPLSFGDFGRIKAGTVLYSNSSFGPHSRVSGEISHSIMQGFCNKQHAGFLGHSHIGEWVNLGADTTVSNLRNDYEHVKVKLNQKLIDSGQRFVGLMCGDHTKTGINMMFNTGSVVGVGANVYGGGYPPRFIRSFSWGGKDGFHFEPLNRTIESAKLAASRRDKELSEAEIELLTEHYSNIVKQEN